ncbi:class I SAM-dependent methyltransferase [Alphaproteobacteria bacterium]|nr:class I SAM-dependent methyltransferase [Alphaproteobacteria bacterium]
MKLYVKKNIDKYELLYKSGHDHSYPNLDFVRIVSKFIEKKQNSRFLDYGFGSGENLIYLSKFKFDLYGLETSKSAINLVKKKFDKIDKKEFKKNLKLIDIKSNTLKFPDNYFDVISCISVISLLENKKNISYLLNEFHRVLKPGGRMIIDINGPKGDFKTKGKYISDEEYEYKLHGDKKLRIYAPKNKSAFKKILHRFKIVDMGEVFFQYFDFKNHEFIACVEKKFFVSKKIKNK